MSRIQDIPNLIRDEYEIYTIRELKALLEAAYYSCPLGDRRYRSTYIEALVAIRLSLY